ncbi:MAG: DUF4123 domain-containing protein [Cellvibrionaceae bacterium]|nr:DUF4123 domain-containing protein [Cellvibrionaceae bacterium]
MVIDAAQDERIYQIILKTQNSKCCLFSDENTSATIKAVAPHLIKIKRMDESIDWCIREGLRRHWIVFFVSNIVHVSDLRLHFKRFSVVQGPERKQYLFRFYDPRVLPAFIASNEQARSEFFRHLLKIWIPQISDNGSLQRLEFTRHQAAVLSAPAFS